MPDTAEAVAQYGSAVYRLAYAMTRSRSDADDVFQEVFLRLHRSAPDFANEEHRILRMRNTGGRGSCG